MNLFLCKEKPQGIEKFTQTFKVKNDSLNITAV